MAETSDRLQTVTTAIMIAIGAYVLGNIVASTVMYVLFLVGIPMEGYPERMAVLSTLTVQGVGFLGFGLVYLHYTDQLDLLSIDRPSRSDIGYLLGGIVAILLSWRVIGIVFTQLLGIDPAESSFIEQGIQNPTLLLVLAPLSILIVGPGEELLYRGIVQGSIRRVLGPVGGILIASAVFASIHVFGLIGSPLETLATLLTVFVLALVLGTVYELSENLLVPALIHGLYNATQFLLAYQQATGGLSGLG
ncbi:CPBP family intramembrane glutamic endopeptidase [Halocatena pleomorpha]|uniref:CPBP family intramembrane metalloprotease n=1 Tax=Halocatena pleomorpha TaxID=1785090 RepID=A0A3P3RF33_9EURY|nr:type II CAAX endopeptidase family protein [Halocatena pleomorpha]RRJ32011.1 CPBP family intramembrane metalloprotease [Halocatena pleomorpha]